MPGVEAKQARIRRIFCMRCAVVFISAVVRGSLLVQYMHIAAFPEAPLGGFLFSAEHEGENGVGQGMLALLCFGLLLLFGRY